MHSPNTENDRIARTHLLFLLFCSQFLSPPLPFFLSLARFCNHYFSLLLLLTSKPNNQSNKCFHFGLLFSSIVQCTHSAQSTTIPLLSVLLYHCNILWISEALFSPLAFFVIRCMCYFVLGRDSRFGFIRSRSLNKKNEYGK